MKSLAGANQHFIEKKTNIGDARDGAEVQTRILQVADLSRAGTGSGGGVWR